MACTMGIQYITAASMLDGNASNADKDTIYTDASCIKEIMGNTIKKHWRWTEVQFLRQLNMTHLRFLSSC